MTDGYEGLLEALRLVNEHESLHAKDNPPRDRCRIYHEEDGSITFAQIGPPWLEQRDDQYIESPAGVMETLMPWHRVKDGRLESLDFAPRTVVKLEKMSHGPVRTVQGLHTVLLEQDEEFGKIDHYQFTNS